MGTEITHRRHDGTSITTFVPENLQFTLNKGENGPHTVQYELSRSRSAVGPDFVGPYRTDFELSVDGHIIIAGPHTDVQINSNEEHVKVAGMDWLHRLQTVTWPFDANDIHAYQYKEDGTSPAGIDDPPEGFAYYATALDPATILDRVSNIILSQPYIQPADFSWSFSPVGTPIDLFTVDMIDTTSLYQMYQTLSQEEPGEFDFYITVGKVITIVAPRQYDLDVVDTPSLAEHTFDMSVPASGLLGVSFRNSGPQYTRLVGTGQSQAYNLASSRQYEPAMDTYGLINGNVSYQGYLTQERISRKTRKNLLFGLNPVHEISIVVAPEAITNFWTRFRPGKAIWVKADLEGHNIDSAQEIVSMDGSTDNNGNLTVSFKLNQIYESAGLLDD